MANLLSYGNKTIGGGASSTDFVPASTGGTFNGTVYIEKEGAGILVAGNNKAAGTSGASAGQVHLYSSSTHAVVLQAEGSVSATRTATFPDKSGIVAFTSDISSDFVSKANGGTFNGNVTIDHADGTSSAAGVSQVTLGNSISGGTAGNSCGLVKIYDSGVNYAYLVTDTLTADRTIKLPNNDGTLALKSDLTARTAGTITAESGYPITTAYSSLVRMGNICELTYLSESFEITRQQIDTWVKIATLSIGPSSSVVRMSAINGNDATYYCVARIDSDGSVYLRPTSSSTSIRITIYGTYFCS